MSPISRFATVVGLYGAGKPNDLKALVASTQHHLGSVIPRFDPRPLHDIHSTLIGLEGAGPVDPDALKLSGVDLDGLRSFLARRLEEWPITIQYGGFSSLDYGVTSRGKRLCERMLDATGDKVVLVGWPVDSAGRATYQLDQLRRELQQFGARHRYHSTPESRDPDSYMVVGELPPDRDSADLKNLLQDCRETLARQQAHVRLTADNVYVATYIDTRMPGSSTTIRPIAA